MRPPRMIVSVHVNLHVQTLRKTFYTYSRRLVTGCVILHVRRPAACFSWTDLSALKKTPDGLQQEWETGQPFSALPQETRMRLCSAFDINVRNVVLHMTSHRVYHVPLRSCKFYQTESKKLSVLFLKQR